MSRLMLDDCQLYYEVSGTGPPIVFLHGLGGNHLSWWQQVPAFRDRYTCVTYAQRNHSPTTTEASARGARAYPDDLTALVEQLGLENIVLVAQSMGGAAAMLFALQNPTRVRALILASSLGSIDQDSLFELIDEHELGDEDPDETVADLNRRGILPAAGERMAHEQPELYYLFSEIDALSVDLDKDAVRSSIGELSVTPLADLASVPFPLLWIFGAQDPLLPGPFINVLRHLLPGELQTIPGAGHSAYFQRAPAFNRLISSCLDRHV